METGNIIQIIDEEHHWFPCLLVVNEIKSFGVMAYITIPDNDRDKANGNAFIRLKKNQYKFVGKAEIYLAGDEE